MVVHSDSVLNQLSLEYSYAELQQASRNFDPSQRLGHGSFGGVFRGIQADGTEVAIKVLDVPEEGGFEEEVRVLSKFRHPNLVILMGFARHEGQRFLVYELLAGGDVFKRLQRSCVDNVPFPWRARISAAFDAAAGLSHLHHATPKVFHRDIKSPNILLDRNGTAKMADFGLACLSHGSEHRVQQASGTVGYACPLYVQRGVVTEGSEVYSFGIVLLELLTASPPAYLAQTADGSQQYQFLVVHISGDARVAVGMADTKAQWNQSIACSVADLALRCTQGSEELRPSFTEIVNSLRALRDAPETPPLPSPAAAAGGLGPSLAPLAANWPPLPKPAPQLQPPQLNFGAGAAALDGGGVGTPATPLGPMLPPTGAAQQGPRLPMAQRQGQPAQQQVQPPQQAPQLLLQQAQQVQQQVQQQQLQAQAPAQLGQPLLVIQQQQQQQQLPLLGGSPMARQSMRPAQAVLWTLECVHSEGSPLEVLPKERRSLVHRQEPGGPLLATLRVGRLFQEDLFNMVVPDDDARGAVSREHFQIWAEETVPLEATPTGTVYRGIPCAFFLTNYSVNGTVVNGRHLQQRGEQVPLHNGDSIALGRQVGPPDCPSLATFLEFRFDLVGSVLLDAEANMEEPPLPVPAPAPAPVRRAPAAALATAAALPVAAIPRQVATGGGAGAGTPLAGGGDGTRHMGAAGSGEGVVFHQLGGSPFFALEVGGTAVREGTSPGQKRILHGPPSPQEPCPPLVLGRTNQVGFWAKLLIEEAFNALSRQHLQIEVCEEGCSGGPTIFHLRNLSERNPIRISNSLEDGAVDAAAPLQRDQRRLLNHGDVIVVNPNQGSTLWLVFRDLTAGRSRQPALGVGEGSESARARGHLEKPRWGV